MDGPGEIALEACKLLTEWAWTDRFPDPLPDGLAAVVNAAEAALCAEAEGEVGRDRTT
jgi:hypothetical protein